MTPLLKKILGMNWLLILVMYGLLICGVFMIESAARHVSVSSEVLKEYRSAGSYFASMQKRWILLGSIVFFTTALIDYRWIRWYIIPFYVFSMILLLVAMNQGDSVHRLQLKWLSFQPSQLGISSGLIMLAWVLDDLPRRRRIFQIPIMRLILIATVTAAPFFIVTKMGDMGSALIWVPILFTALLIGEVPLRYITFIVFIIAAILPIMYLVVLPKVSERGPERINTWLRMSRNQAVNEKNEGYAAHNISMAVGKAGWKGVGWKATAVQGSLHAKGFIPNETAHNDYIFAVIAEETGFRGSLLLLTGFALLLIQGIFIAFYSRDPFGRILVCLILALFFAHIFESIGMCVLLLPITGVPLPLISYSGTFTIICMFLLGLVQSVWVHRDIQIEEKA